MIVYILINVFVVLSSILYVVETKKHVKHNGIINSVYLGLNFTLLFIFAGFRGDFTADYKGYIGLFEYYSNFTFGEILNQSFAQEKGYVLLNKLIASFTNDGTYIMVVTSAIILLLFFKEFKRESTYVWLSVLMFVTIGSYYTSFNIIRQILATSIVFSGSKYLYERKMKKYFIIILIASLFHKTSLIMLLFYFILDINISKKKIFALFSFLIIVFFSLNPILNVLRNYVYSIYIPDDMVWTRLNITSIILPLGLILFIFLHVKNIDTKKKKYKIWINAAVYYFLFCILGLKFRLIQRLSEFFYPYIFLLVPELIYAVKEKKLKIVYIIAIVFILILYNYVVLSGTGYDPYYFTELNN